MRTFTHCLAILTTALLLLGRAALPASAGDHFTSENVAVGYGGGSYLQAPACGAPMGFTPGPTCYDCPSACCQNVWDGYCEEKARCQAFWSCLSAPASCGRVMLRPNAFCPCRAPSCSSGSGCDVGESCSGGSVSSATTSSPMPAPVPAERRVAPAPKAPPLPPAPQPAREAAVLPSPLPPVAPPPAAATDTAPRTLDLLPGEPTTMRLPPVSIR